MKYTIHGFSQEKLIEYDLDSTDALILRYFVDFKDSGKMAMEIHENKPYYWLNYDALKADIPIIGIKSNDALRRRLKKLEESGVLDFYLKKEGGSYSFYTLGSRYSSLICNEEHPTQKSDGPTQKSDGVLPKSRRGPTQKSDQKIHLLEDPSTRNISCCSSKGEATIQSVLHHFEKCGFGLLSSNLIEKIVADIDLYGSEWVMEAATISDEKGKHRYDYIKAILENWKKDGKGAKKNVDRDVGSNNEPSASELCDFSGYGAQGG